MTTYTAYMAACSESAFGRAFATPRGIWHGVKEYWHEGPVWVLQSDTWTPSGTPRIEIQRMILSEQSAAGNSGRFQLRGGVTGDVDGTWEWRFDQDGHGVGHPVSGPHGQPVRIVLLSTDPIGLPAPPADPCGGGATVAYRYMTITTP